MASEHGGNKSTPHEYLYSVLLTFRLQSGFGIVHFAILQHISSLLGTSLATCAITSLSQRGALHFFSYHDSEKDY